MNEHVESTPTTLAELVKSRRVAQGWSQRELAKRIGAQRELVANIESGAIEHPSAEIVENMAKAFGINWMTIYIAAYRLDRPLPEGPYRGR